MAEPVAFKYRAFISYSHADTNAAKWLHRGLEGFRIDKDLVGKETALGPVPKALKPIFRDRDMNQDAERRLPVRGVLVNADSQCRAGGSRCVLISRERGSITPVSSDGK